MDVPDSRLGVAQSGVEGGIVEPVPMELVEADGDVQRRGLGVPVLAGQVGEEPLGRDGEVPDTALEEVSGERRLGCDHEVRGLRPATGFPEVRSEPAEVLLVGALVGPKLRDG